MKTFIWNTEYDVYITSTDTLTTARSLLLKHIEKRYIESSEKLRYHKLKYPYYYLYWKNRNWEDDLVNIKNIEENEILNRDPDIIIEEHQAIIFNHINE